MNTRFKTVLTLAALLGLSVSATAMAGESYLDAGSKMRGQFGTIRGPMTSRPMYRATVPAEQRSYSYEPSQSPSPCDKVDSAQVTPPNATDQRGEQTYRSYSYEPGNRASGSVGRGRSASRPAYELPKTDSRKFGGGW